MIRIPSLIVGKALEEKLRALEELKVRKRAGEAGEVKYREGEAKDISPEAH